MQATATGLVLLLAFLTTAAGGASLPFPEDLLRDGARRPVKEVVENFTLHREMAGLRLSGKLAVFAHLVRHPDFAADLARAAGILNYTIERRGEAKFWADDHKGLTGEFEILRSADSHLALYANGNYKKGIIRLRGRFALAVESSESLAGGSAHVENTVSSYVRLDPDVVHALAALFRPFVARVLDKQMRWFFGKANDLMERLGQDPEAVLKKLPPDTWQAETAQLRLLLGPAAGDPTTGSGDIDPRRGRIERACRSPYAVSAKAGPSPPSSLETSIIR